MTVSDIWLAVGGRFRTFSPMISPVETAGAANPRSTSYEFGGPLGKSAIILTVPVLVYSLYFGCSDQNGCPSPFMSVRNLDPSTLRNPELLERSVGYGSDPGVPHLVHLLRRFVGGASWRLG